MNSNDDLAILELFELKHKIDITDEREKQKEYFFEFVGLAKTINQNRISNKKSKVKREQNIQNYLDEINESIIKDIANGKFIGLQIILFRKKHKNYFSCRQIKKDIDKYKKDKKQINKTLKIATDFAKLYRS